MVNLHLDQSGKVYGMILKEYVAIPFTFRGATENFFNQKAVKLGNPEIYQF